MLLNNKFSLFLIALFTCLATKPAQQPTSSQVGITRETDAKKTREHVDIEFECPCPRPPKYSRLNSDGARSKRIFFLSECIVNQNIRAYGVRNMEGDGPVRPIVDLLARNGIGMNIVECPEILYEGLKRKACGKGCYKNEEFKKICVEIAKRQIDRLQMYINDEYQIGGFICVNGSPTCAIDFCFDHGKCFQAGVFIEEFQKMLAQRHLNLEFIGFTKYDLKGLLFKVQHIIDNMR